MAEKYRRVEKKSEPLPSNEIRVRRGVGIGRYLRRAVEVLGGKEGSDHIVIKGVSNAMESVVKLAELIKHRVKRLFQVSEIQSLDIVDEYEPLEEGLDHLKFKRTVTMLVVTLSTKQLDKSSVGYQDPIDDSEVQEFSNLQERDSRDGGRREFRPRSAGGFRGGFRGRGRGRGFGRGRGGYDNRGDRGDREYGHRDNRENRGDREGGERRRYDNRQGGDRDGGRDNRERRPYNNEGQDREGGRDNRERRPFTSDGRRPPFRGGDREGGDRPYRGRGGFRGGRGSYQNRDEHGGDRPTRGRGEYRGGEYRGGYNRDNRDRDYGGENREHRPYRGRGGRGRGSE